MTYKILSLGETHGSATDAIVEHNGHRVSATVENLRPEQALIGHEFIAEIEWSGLIAISLPASFDPEDSGIWQDERGIHLLGEIHNVIELDGNESLVDVYLMNGPEFFLVKLSDFGGHDPKLGEAVHLIVEQLVIHAGRPSEAR